MWGKKTEQKKVQWFVDWTVNVQCELLPLWNNPVFDVKSVSVRNHWENQRTQETAAKTLRRLWDQWLNWQGPLLHTSAERLSAVIWRYVFLTLTLSRVNNHQHTRNTAEWDYCGFKTTVHPKITIMSLSFLSIQLKSMGSKNETT